MRRLISTLLVTACVLLGTLSLSGCIVPVHDRGGHGGHRDGPDHHDGHDRDRHDGDHDHDHDGDHGH